ILGALKFVTENRLDMLSDQIEVFRRGYLDLPQSLIPEYILAETVYDQSNEATIKDFPAAYIIPPQVVDFLLFNGVQVVKASQPFQLDTVTYPKGTYIVWMAQPKRGLANAFLEDRVDVVVMQEMQSIQTNKVNKANLP
ncbi:MAG TPA: hypothetical protein VJ910_12125, partial [Desulfuromonadales bacterium]|nr:hypothetical protein [Desulfuromonadales bacterium]